MNKIPNEKNLVSAGGSGWPVALECEVVLWVSGIHVLYRHPAFDRAQSEAGGLFGLLIFKDGDTAMLVLKWRLDALVFGWLALQ